MKKLVSLCTAAVLCLTLLASCAPKPDSSSPSPSPDAEPVDLAAFAQSVQENHQFASLEKADPADEELGAIMLENNYPGLKDMDLEQTEVYLPMISFSGGGAAPARRTWIWSRWRSIWPWCPSAAASWRWSRPRTPTARPR